jgi:hypothetical protein
MKRGTDQVFRHVGLIGEIDAGFFMLAAQPGLPARRCLTIAFALHNANRLLRPIFAETNFSRAKLFIFRPAGGCCGLETLAMFKLPAYDPFAITVMGFGVAIVAVIALAF